MLTFPPFPSPEALKGAHVVSYPTSWRGSVAVHSNAKAGSARTGSSPGYLERCARRCGRHLRTRWLVWKGLEAAYQSPATAPSICISLRKWCHTPAMHMQTVNTSPTLNWSLPPKTMPSCRTLSSSAAKFASLQSVEKRDGLMQTTVKSAQVLYHQAVYSLGFYWLLLAASRMTEVESEEILKIMQYSTLVLQIIKSQPSYIFLSH